MFKIFKQSDSIKESNRLDILKMFIRKYRIKEAGNADRKFAKYLAFLNIMKSSRKRAILQKHQLLFLFFCIYCDKICQNDADIGIRKKSNFV